MVFYEFLRELGYHPSSAKYILLLDKVCKTFFWYGIIYVGLVITPAFSFFLMVDEKESVYPTEISKLMAKTFVMFVGEVELFDVSDSKVFKSLEIGFFLFFIFFLAVVLMNLLNALAIVDTRELVEDAEMEMLFSLMETVSFWENLKQNDPHNRLSMSFLSLIKARQALSCFIPDMTCCYDGEDDDKVIKIRPFQKSREKFGGLSFMGKKKDQKNQSVFGKEMEKIIVNTAMDIFNEREEAERIQ